MRVLVTRPEPGAARTAARLAALGHQPILLPLSETRPLPTDDVMLPADAAAVAVTSANALRHAQTSLLGRLAHLPCYAVGRRTGEASRNAGFGPVSEGPGDAAGLAEAIGPKLAGGTLVYLCGRERFPGFEADLAASGVRVHAVETYDTVPLDWPSEAVAARLGHRSVTALLLYSARAAQAAAALLARPELAELFGACRVLALSERIGGAFRAGAATGKVCVAAAPNEDGLVELLGAVE
jgi:uroporphyrinogen-III synthase